MQAATQLLVLIMGGLFLGQWLVNDHQWPDLTLLVMPILGFVLGLMMLYKQSLTESLKAENRLAEKGSKDVSAKVGANEP